MNSYSHCLETERLLLRHWRDSDLDPFAALCADPRVMEHFPDLLDYEQSRDRMVRAQRSINERGFGLFAVEVKGGAPFIGFVGLAVPAFEAPFTPCVEIGWRLAFDAWGQGYASEAAREVLRFAFEEIGLLEVVSFTANDNVRSQRVMQRIGMIHSPEEEFDHPMVTPGHRLSRHQLYRCRREDWAVRDA